MIDTEKNWI